MKFAGRWIAMAGFVILVLWKMIFYLTIIDTALGFSFLVLVPLLLEEVIHEGERNRAEKWLYQVMLCSLPFAGAGVIAVTLPPGRDAGWWAAVWLFYTMLIAFGGLMRLLGRGIRPREETVIDAGLIYIAVGGVWLVLASGGFAPFLPYSGTIVQLTAIHFHYAAFVLPLVTGFFGRYLAAERKQRIGKPYLILTVGVMAGPFLVALGLDQGPPTEVFTVGLYVLILAWLCIWWLWISVDFKGWVKIGLRAASLLLLMTMVFSFTYSLGLMKETYWLGIDGMLKWHGAYNAFGFSLFAAMAWRGAHPSKRFEYTNFPVSRLRGNGYVGNDIIYDQGWTEVQTHAVGLVSEWEKLRSADFKPGRLDRTVKQFYTATGRFDMKAHVHWKKGFRRLSVWSHRMTSRMGQINIPLSGEVEMDGEIVSIADDKDGRNQVRAWIRRNKQTEAPIFTALYSSHRKMDEGYMNIGLPFPRGVMTGVLRPLNDDRNGLVLTSVLRDNAAGDEGVYFTLGDWTFRTPLKEVFHVEPGKEGELRATHHMSLGPVPFLEITYLLTKKNGGELD